MVFNITQDLYNYYLWTLTLADSRTKDWLLVPSPLPTLFFTLSYLVIVWMGPKIMKPRKPFKLKGPLVIYNLGITLLNVYIFLLVLRASLKLGYNYVCEAYRDSNDHYELQVTEGIWWFYFSKLLEFCDTFFFILRKKDAQLSFLHIYHHATMFPLWWIGVKWVPGGSACVPVLINCWVHIFMYSYYGLSALGPQVAQYLWWKKYLTILQLIQFTVGLVLAINAIRIDCQFPAWMHYTAVFYMISFVILFGNFYMKSYLKKRNKKFYGVDFGCGQGIPHEKEMSEKSVQKGKYEKNSSIREINTTAKKFD